MPKYVGNQEYLTPKRSFADKLAIASEGVSRGLQAFGQMKQQEEARRVLSDPNATPIQKATALANLGQEKLGVEVFKKSADQSLIADVEQRLNARLGRSNEAIPVTDAGPASVPQPGEGGTPSQRPYTVGGPSSAARNAVQMSGGLGLTANQYQAPPEVPQGTPQNVPQAQPQVTPEDEIDAYDEAAQQLANSKPSVSKYYENKANQIRKDVRQDRKFFREIERDAIKDEQDIRKESAPYIEGVLNAYKGSKNQEAILNQMDGLAKNRDLTTPLMNNLLGAIGMPLGILNNPDSEEFEKLSNNLTRDITKFYGARINQTEFVNFLKQIPTLNNSEEGRIRVISNLKKMLEPAGLEYRIMSEIMAENGGKPIPNMNFEVTKRMEPTLEKWASEINNDMHRLANQSTPLASDEVVMVFPDGARKRVPKSEVGKWSQWGKLE